MIKVKSILNIITYLCVVTGYASVIEYLGIYHSVAFVALLAIAAYLDYNRLVELPRWLLNITSVLVIGLSCFRISPEYIIEPILDTLIILIAIKLIENKKFRDYMQIFAMCIFLLMGSSLISLSSVFLIYFLIVVTLSTISLVLLAYFAHDSEMAITRENVTRIVLHSLLICSISIPASAFFFLILPRTNYPLLSFLNRYERSRSGFSDKITLGEVSEIQEDGNTIFRAEMERVKENRLYWRGIVMDQFDGVSWKNSSEEQKTPRHAPEGQKVTQTIYLEPYGNKYLFALDTPESFYVVRRKSPHTRIPFSLRTQIQERIKYMATSVIWDIQPEDDIDYAHYVQLPKDFSPRIREMVKNLTDIKAGNEKIKALLHFLREKDFKYSLKDLPVSQAPLEDFLFEIKHGNCEYFASSLAVMLRMADIPARLVGGYKGGYYNKTGGYYLVLQKNAHVWVEAYSRDHNGKQGWIRLDPTPFSLDVPSVRYGESIFLQIKLLLDTFNYYWNKFVITYDFNRQLAILQELKSSFKRTDLKLDWKAVDFKKYIYIPLILTLPALIAAGWVLRKKRKECHEKLVSKFMKRMASYGYKKHECEGLEELVARVDQEDLKCKANAFVNEFQNIFYKDCRFSRQQIERLENHIRNL